MAISFINSTNTTYASRTNTTVNAPAGLADGDYMVAWILTGAASSSPTVTPPSGWTQLTSTNGSSGGFNVKVWTYGKVASSEPSSWTWTHSTSSSQGAVLAYRGVDTGTPMDATGTTNTGTGATCTWLGLTTVTNGAMVLALEMDWGNNTNDTVVPTGTTPTFTERYDVVLSYACDGIMTTAGATGNKTHTCNAGGEAWQSHLLALRPAAGGTPGTFTTLAGNATAEGGSSTFTGEAAFSTVAGTAAAGGGSSTFTGEAVFATAAGNATAAGGTSTFTGAAVLTTLAGDAAAAGGESTFSGGASSAFTTLAGDAVAAGGVSTFTAPGTFTTLAGGATAEGGSTSFLGEATFATLVGGAAAAGGTSTFAGDAVFTTTSGDAAASGGESVFIAGDTPLAIEHIGTHRETSVLGTAGSGSLGVHRETANL